MQVRKRVKPIVLNSCDFRVSKFLPGDSEEI